MKSLKTFHSFTLMIALATGLILTGCDATSSLDAGSPGDLTLQFSTTGNSNAKLSAASTAVSQATDQLIITGSNGTLIVDDLRFIVEDFTLERSDVECDNGQENAENCDEFESPPFFVDLPLQADTLTLNTSPIEPGLYEELEFEIDDLDLDEESGDDRSAKQQLADLVRSEFPDWPDEVSMLIVGSFISNNNDTTSFRTYAEAEVEIEIEFEPPLEINENTPAKVMRVNIDPQNWFLTNDGSVVDLSAYDYDTTGRILEFEVEIENGFENIEVEDDEDEDDDDNDDDDDDDDEDDD